MDAQRFDAFARSIGAASSRRQLGLVMGGLSIASALAVLPFERAGSKKKKKKKRKDCARHCSAGICCDGKCVSVLTDRTNCGRCGNVCGAAQYCLNGQCMPCDEPMAICSSIGIDRCINVKTDRENCGACNVPCAKDSREPKRDLVCQNGQCVCTGTTCANGRCCPADYNVCVDGGNGCCPTNFHSCGNGECCPNGYTCGGSCGQGCCVP